MTGVKSAARAYVQQAVLTAGPEKLVAMLFETAMRELRSARSGLASGSGPAQVGKSLGKAFSIISELKTALDMDRGGEIAANLDRIYRFVQQQISRANQERRPDPLDDALHVLGQIKEGWDGLLRAS